MAALARRIMDYLRYVQTWIWIWGIVSTSTVGVVIWALITRLPGVVVFVLALGAGALMLIALETALIVHEKIKHHLWAHYERAVVALDGLRTKGVVLRSRSVTSDAELTVFVDDLAAWEAEVLAAMQGAATHTDISWFRDLHEWKVQYGVSAYNDDHALMKAALDEKLRRMLVIADKLEAKVQ
ncbi:MAG TPA: hypothetical protein VEK86_12625 [Gemmatimonadales bacterium]|nr:hypothetical protein [Gemmatimonadales bacterium]